MSCLQYCKVPTFLPTNLQGSLHCCWEDRPPGCACGAFSDHNSKLADFYRSLLYSIFTSTTNAIIVYLSIRMSVHRPSRRNNKPHPIYSASLSSTPTVLRIRQSPYSIIQIAALAQVSTVSLRGLMLMMTMLVRTASAASLSTRPSSRSTQWKAPYLYLRPFIP